MGERIYNELTRAEDPVAYLANLNHGGLSALWQHILGLGVADGVPLEMWHLTMAEGARRFFDEDR
jgi:hypothetical protein